MMSSAHNRSASKISTSPGKGCKSTEWDPHRGKAFPSAFSLSIQLCGYLYWWPWVCLPHHIILTFDLSQFLRSTNLPLIILANSLCHYAFWRNTSACAPTNLPLIIFGKWSNITNIDSWHWYHWSFALPFRACFMVSALVLHIHFVQWMWCPFSNSSSLLTYTNRIWFWLYNRKKQTKYGKICFLKVYRNRNCK